MHLISDAVVVALTIGICILFTLIFTLPHIADKQQAVATELEYTSVIPLIRLQLHSSPPSEAYLALQNPASETVIVNYISHWNRTYTCGESGGVWFATEANELLSIKGDSVNGTLLARNSWVTIAPQEAVTIMSYKTKSEHNRQLFLTYASSVRGWVHGSVLRRSGRSGFGAWVHFSHEVKLPLPLSPIPAVPQSCAKVEE